MFYLARLSFRIEEESKCFVDKKKINKSITRKPDIQEMLNGFR